MVEMRGFEPLTSSMRSKTPELPNLLKFLEAIDITDISIGQFFHILAGFGIFLTHFLTQILTQNFDLPTSDYRSMQYFLSSFSLNLVPYIFLK